MDDRKKIVQKKEETLRKAEKLETQVGSLQRELASLKKYQKTDRKKGEMIKSLEEENKRLETTLNQMRRKLSVLKTMPLTIKPIALPTTITEERVHLPLAAEGGSLPYSWHLEGNLPNGVSFNRLTGTISGMVKSAGDYNFNVKVTDAKGVSVKTKKGIAFKVIKKYEKQGEKVSSWFVILTLISSLLLMYIIWGKYKIRKAIKKMEAEGWSLKWVK
jgi:TolA-binding protein